MRVRLKNTTERLGLTGGEVYEATPYWLDPDKVTLLARVPDGFNPECNEYRDRVEVIR